jgi:hypothetical protein
MSPDDLLSGSARRRSYWALTLVSIAVPEKMQSRFPVDAAYVTRPENWSVMLLPSDVVSVIAS